MSTVRTAKRLKLAAMVARPTPPPSAKPEVAIADLTARAVREPADGATYVIVRVETDQGVTGYGETHARPDPATAVARIMAAREKLLGQDALAGEAVRRSLGDLPAEVRAAVDIALLDIKGKIADAPIYQVLSGRTRDKARAYAPLQGSSFAELRTSLDHARAAGFRAFALPIQIPAGPTRGRQFYTETLDFAEKLRDAGADDLVLDCAGRTTAAEAAGLAALFEKFRPLWIDEPTTEINEEALRKISGESATPVGWGRAITDNGEFQDLLRLEAIDVLRPDIALLGISQARRAAVLAEAYYTAVAPANRGGPIATAAGLHIAASTPNFVLLEVPFPPDPADRKMRQDLAGPALEQPADGFLNLPTGPGLGIEIDETTIEKYEVTA